MWVQIALLILVPCQDPKPVSVAFKEPKRVDAVVVSVGDLFQLETKPSTPVMSLVISDITVLKSLGTIGGGRLHQFEAKEAGVCHLKFTFDDKAEDEVIVVVEKPTAAKKPK